MLKEQGGFSDAPGSLDADDTRFPVDLAVDISFETQVNLRDFFGDNCRIAAEVLLVPW